MVSIIAILLVSLAIVSFMVMILMVVVYRDTEIIKHVNNQKRLFNEKLVELALNIESVKEIDKAKIVNTIIMCIEDFEAMKSLSEFRKKQKIKGKSYYGSGAKFID